MGAFVIVIVIVMGGMGFDEIGSRCLRCLRGQICDAFGWAVSAFCRHVVRLVKLDDEELTSNFKSFAQDMINAQLFIDKLE